MSPDPPSRPPVPPECRESLEDRVYRSSLGEGDRALARAGRGAGPVALAVCGALGVAAAVAARHAAPGLKAIPSVALVLQEGPEPPPRPVPPPPSAQAPPRPPAPAALPSPRPAPAAPPSPRAAPAPPPPAAPAAAPETAPAALPTEDPSRDPRGDAGSGAEAAGVPGGTGSGGGGGSGGPGQGGARGGGVATLDLSQVRVTFSPPSPDYPLLARKAGVQGNVTVPIMVGADGVPVSAKAADGPLLLRGAAEKFALAYRFEPYRVNGVAQPFQYRLTVTFTLNK